jgi:hypothetical protein
MSAMADGTEPTLPDEAVTEEETVPTPVLTAVETPANADSGDVFPDAVAIGFSDATLDMAEADEELAALEEQIGSGGATAVEAEPDALPDEASPPGPDPPEGAISADAGDVEGDGPPVGIAPADLEQAEEDEELHAVEPDTADPALPDEQAPASGELVTQPSKAPTRKVKAAGLGGILGAIPAPILAMLDLVHVSDATLGTISSALTVLGSVAAAYLARDKAA